MIYLLMEKKHTCVQVPVTGAQITVSIFMALITTSCCPAVTLAPGLTCAGAGSARAQQTKCKGIDGHQSSLKAAAGGWWGAQDGPKDEVQALQLCYIAQ